MPQCPNCGGEMKFDKKVRLYVCHSCGLMMSRKEIDMLRDKRLEDDKSLVEEYLEWWQKRKTR